MSAQSIVTIAGGGTDDGRPATVAGLYGPSKVAVDSEGNLYIADTYNHRIRRVTVRNGLITTVVGNGARGITGDGGAATAAAIEYPQAVAVDAGGALYVASRNRIRKVVNGIITTIAGNGSGEFSGDNGPATGAGLNAPIGLALDVTGNLYIADSENSRIRRVDSNTGIITTVAGNGSFEFSGDGGAATTAGLSRPYGLALDIAGNLLIADLENARVRRVDAGTGKIATIARNGIQGFSGDGGAATAASLFRPDDVALDAAGNLYIADSINCRIRKVTAQTGIITTIAGNGSVELTGDGGAATGAGVRAPTGVAVDPRGNVYVVDFYNNRIRKVAIENAVITTVAGNGAEGFTGDGGPATAAQLDGPSSVALDSDGSLYVADYTRVHKVAARTGIITTVAGKGAIGYEGDGGSATAAKLAGPLGLTIDTAGNLYIADTGNHRIRKVAAVTGIISTVAGNGSTPDGVRGGFSGDGGPATSAALYDPYGVTLDAEGNLYIADTLNNRIRKVSAQNGVIATVAGNGSEEFSGDGGPATTAGLGGPSAVAVDSAGNLYIADQYNHRIRKVQAETGTITTVAGSFPPGDRGDGGPATAAGLAQPRGVALDSAGNFYIAELSGSRIRKVVSGIITSVAGNGSTEFSGDGGAATAAGLSVPPGLTVDSQGNVYIAELFSNRVRAVFTCVSIPVSTLTVPSDGEQGVGLSTKLAWSPAKGAFSYDVFLDTANPPLKIIASDVASPAYNPSNLEPLTKYYWKVVAKGDSFCDPLSASTSEVFSFTTSGNCGPPGEFAVSE